MSVHCRQAYQEDVTVREQTGLKRQSTSREAVTTQPARLKLFQITKCCCCKRSQNVRARSSTYILYKSGSGAKV